MGCSVSTDMTWNLDLKRNLTVSPDSPVGKGGPGGNILTAEN